MNNLIQDQVNQTSQLETDPLIDESAVRRLLGGLSRPGLYARIRRGAIPKPMKLGQLSRWRRSWIENVVADAERAREVAQ
ncbi:helix-turn-helix transcriptional regulator [Ochrobactrum sp. MYb379]|uniref:helix-turn-helix transcriptional regulator n=1 Tax=Ochrobactrum sp. MYb379 TaxID=2745275 RepID=UPI0030B2344B